MKMSRYLTKHEYRQSWGMDCRVAPVSARELQDAQPNSSMEDSTRGVQYASEAAKPR